MVLRNLESSEERNFMLWLTAKYEGENVDSPLLLCNLHPLFLYANSYIGV